MLIKLQTFDALVQVELVEVIESHEMPVTSENIHFAVK
jgi:hypothetical protein